jgi:hypothetical protein
MSETVQASLLTGNAASLVPAPFTSSTTNSFDPADLDPSLILAVERGFVVAPILTHSRFASARSYVGAPVGDIEEIVQAAIRYPRCNWTLDICASDLTVLEIDTRISYQSLAMLCRNSFGRWTKTLQFRDETSRFFLFRSSAGTRVRFLGQRVCGVKIHSGHSFILIPPSWFVSGRLSWINSGAILDCPDWLLEPAPSSGTAEEGAMPPSADMAPWESPDYVHS